MEGSTDANAAELPSFLPATKQSTFHNDQRMATAYNAQGQIGNLEIRDGLPATMGDIMEDRQPYIVSHTQADREGEAEDIHMMRHSYNTVDIFAGIQHSGVNWVSSKTQGENERQVLDDGDKTPIQYSSNMGGDAQDDDEAMDNHLPPANTAEVGTDISGDPHQSHLPIRQAQNDVLHEERGTSVDVEGAAGQDDDGKNLVDERDPEIEEHTCFGCNYVRAHEYPRTRQIIAQHLSIPDQQPFASLRDLLSSHNAPGRGLYKIEEVLRDKKRKAADLEEDIRCLQAQLHVVSELRDEAGEIIRQARTTFSETCGAAGISQKLWAEYETFCESLEPKFGGRGGWSVTCFHNHNGSYVQWDPDLDLFKDSAGIPLGNRNFRCEATTINSNGSTEYVVEFWPLASPEPRTETARTWKQQYPKLYRLAREAANNSLGDNTVAKALLQSLPDPNLPFSGGWLFEYALEPARAQHPTSSRRWSYRSACRIPVDGQQDPDQGDLTTTSESESTTTQDEEMDYDESESCESQDVIMGDGGSETDESWITDGGY